MIFDFYGSDNLSEREQSLVNENKLLEKENEMLIDKLKQVRTAIDIFCSGSNCDDCENCKLFNL